MKNFFKDVYDLFTLNANEIGYYKKYSIAASSLIILIAFIPFQLIMPIPAADATAGFILSLIGNFLNYIIGALFLCLWLKIKKLSVSFAALYSLSALVSIIYILVLPIDMLSKWLDLTDFFAFVFVFLVLLSYWLVMFTSALSKSTNTSKGFALSGILLTSLLIIIVSTLVQILGMEMGILLLPDDIPVS